MADKARALINAFLSQYGLEGLGDWAWQQHLDGASVDQIMLDVRDRPEYKARFPAMEQLAKEGKAISERAYLDYESSVRGLLQQYAITPGLYDTPQGIADLLINDVSAAEVNNRLQLAATAAYSAPDEVKNALRQFGVDPGQLASFYLDPDRALPLIQQQYQAAQVMGAANQQRIALQREEAERLAKQGVGWDEARQGFAAVAATAGLGAGAGETSDQQTRVAAAFGDSQAQQQVARVQASRKSQFAGGGGGAETQQGVSGLGGAST